MNIGAPEIFVLFVFAVVLGGAFITIDAVTRPAAAYRTGSKNAWMAMLVFTNPLLTRWFGGTLWLATMPLFMIAAVTYYATNRHGNPTPRPLWMWLAGAAVVAAMLVANSIVLLNALRESAPEA